MRIVGHHSKLEMVHFFNETFQDKTFCGISRSHRVLKVTQDRNRVTCGSCVALLATTAAPAAPVTPTCVRVLYLDSDQRSPTVWELVRPGVVVPLAVNGTRLPQEAPFGNVESMYGPLMAISEVELLALQYLSLESRVQNLE